MSVCGCVFLCMYVCLCVRERVRVSERERVCVCECVCVCARERERECNRFSTLSILDSNLSESVKLKHETCDQVQFTS